MRQNFRPRQLRGRTVFIGIAKDEFAGFDRRPGARCRLNPSSLNYRGGEPVAVAKMFTYMLEWRYRLQIQRRQHLSPGVRAKNALCSRTLRSLSAASRAKRMAIACSRGPTR